MMRMGRLNKVEKFYIGKNRTTLSIEQMAKDLNRGVKTVAKYEASLPTVEKDTEPFAPSFDGLLAKETEGAVIMTRQAAEFADESVSEPELPDNSDRIFKIKE